VFGLDNKAHSFYLQECQLGYSKVVIGGCGDGSVVECLPRP
jgi:hypothetical protein